MFNEIKKEIQIGDTQLILETGKIARQATASVVARMGDTMVLCSVVANKKPKEDIDFLPLSVHYQEKLSANGRIPGGFHKRETRPGDRETLISRLIDRPIRPLFPSGFYNEVQIICTLLSYDPAHQPDIVALLGTSAALAISGLPFGGPIGAIRVGYKEGEYLINPSPEALMESQLDLVVAGTETAVLMVESEAKELSEEIMLEGVMFGHRTFKSVIKAIKEMADEVGNESWKVELDNSSEVVSHIDQMVGSELRDAYKETKKSERYAKIDELKQQVIAKLVTEQELPKVKVLSSFEELRSQIVRNKAINEKVRIDGRAPEDVRQIVSEINLLPRVHGSALFTRGETQALVTVTLGTGEDEQLIDDILGLRKDRFLVHYNFPPYSVGETGPMRAPGRREIGHGKLAFRSLNPLMPSKEEFPYTIRIISEITESNGSSSMASVCGGSLALMAAGVPLAKPIAGIAMGLMKEGEKFVVLSDIMGDEDYLGDMDFKVAGTENGITALQMDIKIDGITEEIMQIALNQAKAGRKHILMKMSEALSSSNTEISNYAPQIKSFKIPKEKIGEIIGPGGKMIKSIIERTKVKIDISDDGTVNVASSDVDGMAEALKIINDLIAVAEVGKIYEGKVSKVMDFGIFVNLLRNLDGLVHVSEMIGKLNEFKEGQMVKVKVVHIDNNNRVKLTMKISPDAGDPGSNDKVSAVSSEPASEDNSGVEGSSHKESEGNTLNRRPRPKKFSRNRRNPNSNPNPNSNTQSQDKDSTAEKPNREHNFKRENSNDRPSERSNNNRGRNDRKTERPERNETQSVNGKKRRFF